MAHNRAAFAREDVEDAKAGEPSLSLQPWAETRGLEFMGSRVPGAFRGVLPRFTEYVFNLSRGEVSPGRFGVCTHELMEVGVSNDGSPEMPGSYHSLRYTSKIGGPKGLLRTMIPFGSLFHSPKAPTKPFQTSSVWIPTSKAVLRVPETTSLAGILLRPAERFPFVGNPKLDDFGLPGFRIAGTDTPEPLLSAIAQAAQPLLTLGGAYASLTASMGAVAVVRNGFVNEATMGQLVGVASQIAENLAAVAGPTLSPQPFTTALPPPDPDTWPPGMGRPDRTTLDVLVRVSAELSMVQEDPVAFHRGHPRCPAPGRAVGVIRGLIPGTSVQGRLGFFVMGGNTSGAFRTSVMVPARPGASTPLGGVLDGESDLYIEISDGVVYAWPRAFSWGALNAAATASVAVPTLRRLGLADV